MKLVFNNTGILSAYLCILTPSIFLIIDLNTNSNKTLVLAIIILGLMLFILKSRSSLIAYSIGIIYLLYNKTHLKNKFFYIIGFLSFTMLPLYLLMNLKKSSFKGRKFIYELCLDLCKDSPLTGYGYKSFDHLYNMHQADFFKKNIHSYDLHLLADNIHLSLNDYIHTYIENGIIGLILFLLLLYFSLSTINSIKDDKYLKSSILIFYTLCLFSYPLQIFSIQVYIISLLSWLSKTSKKQYIIKNKIIHISMYIGMIISLLYNIFNLSNTLKWKKAYELSTINQTNSLLLYKNIEFFFTWNNAFLLEYGILLNEQNKFVESFKILEILIHLYSDTEIYVLQGDNLVNFNKPKSKYYYEIASFMTPNRLLPKYKLMSFYMSTKQTDKAYYKALEILETPMKINNPTGFLIKKEASKIITNFK
ncbi:O-antigen ligase family protein [Siphonobacter curvatus]|uniref:O-antigen ligase family protein n=1 Tax=Siphonobacter curvatus TaxID=2094562 RepID=UPI0013FE3AB9|nr:O-antigen ligase family protein [Siphonobacter curvatus]